MSLNRRLRIRAGGAIALASVALLVAACGSSSNDNTSTSAPPSTSASSGSGGTAVVVKTAKGSDGTYLADGSGRALYLWVADSGGMSVCSGACAKAWPPLTTKGKPSAGSGATASDLGTVKRNDGAVQVTYKGHPLYYYIGDTSAGATSGQGSNGFGAKWWLVTPSGAAITSGGSSSSGGGYSY